MGAVYTNTDNVIVLQNSDTEGKQGYPGVVGPTGNSWAYMPDAPNQTAINNGTQIPVDSDGNTFPTDSAGSWPTDADAWLNYITGEYYIYDATAATWDLQDDLLIGGQGAANYLKTKVSFCGINDNNGFEVNTLNTKTLVGHVIFPGTNLTGAINSVQVLVNTNSGGDNIRAFTYLVNLGLLDSGIDDIVVAESTNTLLNGYGDNTSWKILDLSITAANVPSTREVFALFVLLRADITHENGWIKQLQSTYNNEIAAYYADLLKKTELTTRNSFYNILEENYGMNSQGEAPIERLSRQNTRRVNQGKKNAYEQQLQADFEATISRMDNPYAPFLSGIQEIADMPISYTPNVKVAHLVIS